MALCLREEQGCLEICQGPAERWWVRAGWQSNVDDLGVGVCCRLPDRASFRQAEETSCSLSQVLTGALISFGGRTWQGKRNPEGFCSALMTIA